MIRHLFTALCALALITAGGIPALATKADTNGSACYYPISMEEYTYEERNEPRINKVYQFSFSDNPSDVPTEDFARNGRSYHLLDMARKDEMGANTKPHTKIVTRSSDTSSMEETFQGLEAELGVTTEESYTSVLCLDRTSIQMTTDGYTIKAQPLSATRNYPSLSEADLSLILRSTEEEDKTLTLADVQWGDSGQTDGAGNAVTHYTAAASCTGTSSYQYATGYTVTANHTGKVAKTGCDVVTYTAIFDSMEAPEKSTESESGNSTASAGVDLSTLKMPLLAGGIVIILTAGSVFAFKELKKRRRVPIEITRLSTNGSDIHPMHWSGQRIGIHDGRPRGSPVRQAHQQ